PQFTLANEGNSPVFVPTSAIDAGSGSVSSASSRRVTQFGAVNDRVSDLHGQGEQLTLRLSPDVFKLRNRLQLYTSASYTLQQSRRQFRGFDGGDFGDPRATAWAPSNNDARHVVVLSGAISESHIGTFTAFSRLQSGLP